MIIGNGQLAQAFKNSNTENIVIFASGVPNSNCTDIAEFEREKNLLMETLSAHKDLIFVYFSSCALSGKDYPKNSYYQHKEEIELYIKKEAPVRFYRGLLKSDVSQ